MEHLYTQYQDRCKLVKTGQNRIKFLMDYSKSLNIMIHKGMTFENNLN